MAPASSTGHLWPRPDVRHYGQRAVAGGSAMFMLLGMVLTLLGQQYAQNYLGLTIKMLSTWGIIALVAAPIVGLLLMIFSTTPAVSLTGVVLMSGGFGVLLGVTEPGVAVLPLITSAGLSIVLAPIGWFVRTNLQGWMSWLLGMLSLLLFAMVGDWLINVLALRSETYDTPNWISWAAVPIFGAMMIYDWNQIRRMEPTLDNMIDGGGSAYLSWLNLYLHIRNIMGD